MYPIADDDLTKNFITVTIVTSVLQPQTQISSHWEQDLETFHSSTSIQKDKADIVIPLQLAASSSLSDNIVVDDLIDEMRIYTDLRCTITLFRVKKQANLTSL